MKRICPFCNKETEFKHCYSTAWGITETDIDNTEHFICEECNRAFFHNEENKKFFNFKFQR